MVFPNILSPPFFSIPVHRLHYSDRITYFNTILKENHVPYMAVEQLNVNDRTRWRSVILFNVVIDNEV